MIELGSTIQLAQNFTDWGDLIVLIVIIAASVFGGVGKWIARRINERREREEEVRRISSPSSTTLSPPRPPLERARPLPSGQVRTEHVAPPLAQPVPPVRRRVPRRIDTSAGGEPAVERMLEVILEQATGMKIERQTPPPELRPASGQVPPPPPIPRKRPSTARQPASSAPQPARPVSIAERERQRAEQLAKKRTTADREAARLESREARFSRETDQRIGHVETHIQAFDRDDVQAPSEPGDWVDPFERTSLADAIILSEILGPPVALRGDS